MKPEHLEYVKTCANCAHKEENELPCLKPVIVYFCALHEFHILVSSNYVCKDWSKINGFEKESEQ